MLKLSLWIVLVFVSIIVVYLVLAAILYFANEFWQSVRRLCQCPTCQKVPGRFGGFVEWFITPVIFILAIGFLAKEFMFRPEGSGYDD